MKFLAFRVYCYLKISLVQQKLHASNLTAAANYRIEFVPAISDYQLRAKLLNVLTDGCEHFPSVCSATQC